MKIALTFDKAGKPSETNVLCSTADAMLDCLFPNIKVRRDLKDPTINYILEVEPSELSRLEAEVILVNENLRQYEPAITKNVFEVISPKFK